MDSLQHRHQWLVERHHSDLCAAAAALLARPGWDLQAPALLIGPADGERARCLPVGQLGRWIDHLPAELDAFVRLRQQGVAWEEARRRCEQDQGEGFSQAWQRAEAGHPLVSHDDLSRFVDLSRRGFLRMPRHLLVVVQWPEQVTAFLVSCWRQGSADPLRIGTP